MQERGHGRRLRFVRALDPVELPSPRERETAASILPGAPRVGALDALLREVDDLRLTLETDLTLAAAAVEAGGSKTASDIIDGDLESLHAFEASAMGHLAHLAAQPAAVPVPAPSRRARWAHLPAAPFVAAAAVVGLLLGVLPQVGGSGGGTGQVSSVSAQSSLEQLTTLAAQGRTSEVRVAALTLHDQISALVGQSSNPATAQQALLLLSYERTVIVQSGDGAALHDVLLQSAALAAKIRSALPSSLRSRVPSAPALSPAIQPAPQRETARPRATSSPSPAPRPTSSPKPKSSPTPSPKPTSSPSSSPSGNPSSSPDPTMPFLPYSGSGGGQTPPAGGTH